MAYTGTPEELEQAKQWLKEQKKKICADIKSNTKQLELNPNKTI